MRYVLGKSWPWPVLRPFNDDYERCEIQVEVELTYVEDSPNVRVEADFMLSDRDLLTLVSQGAAEYALLISCSRTHFRRTITSGDSRVECEFDGGQLVQHVEFAPHVICTSPISNFKAANWHSDYADREFDLEPGAVLALDTPSTAWIDSANEASVASIFRLSPSSDIEDGQWACSMEEDGRVHILIHPRQYEEFNAARGRPFEETGAYILNSVYLPALVWLLHKADQMKDGPEPHEELWWHAVDAALERADLRELPDENRDALRDAQLLLKFPFSRLPLLNTP